MSEKPNGGQIREFRKAKGLSQEAFGKLCGVGKSTVSQWEAETFSPKGSALLLLREYMDGTRSIIPLTQQEERLLDENVQRGNFASREDYLAASLMHLIRHGGFDIPRYPESAGDPPVLRVADETESPSYKVSPRDG